jgi:hypothetical protein
MKVGLVKVRRVMALCIALLSAQDLRSKWFRGKRKAVEDVN